MSDKDGNLIVSQSDIDSRNQSVKILYYILYASVMGFAVLVIPFTYFYYEEYDENVSVGQRIWAGFKYTIFLVLFLVVLLVVGAFVRPGTKPIGNQNVKDWLNSEILNQGAAESSLLFTIACLTLLGFVVWITYTAYGLSALPIGLIKGKRRLEDDQDHLNKDLRNTKEKSSYYTSRAASGKTLSAKEESTLSLLKSKERALNKRYDRLDQSNRGLKKLLVIFRPFAFIFGFIFLLITALLMISIVLSIIDRISSSVCGSACGFLTTYPKLKNPIDIILLFLAPYFPVDYFILGAIIFYFYFSTMSGIVRIGIRFLWVHMYEFGRRKTLPQGLLCGTVLLMFSILCLNMQLLTLAPRYSMFGTQVFLNATSGETLPCSIDAPTGLCVMSQIGVLVTRIQLGTSFFGIIYYYATWAFVGAFLLGCIISLVKKRQSNVVEYDSDDDF
eukprot:gene4794-5979_t